MITPLFRGTVKQGKIYFEERNLFDLYVGQFENKQINITVKKHRKKRSTGKPDELGNQNGYYFGIIIPLSAKELGYTIGEMHEVFTAEFAPFVYKDFGEKKIAVKIRTSQMDTKQFMEYCDSIIIKMAQMNIIIPEPTKV